MGTSVPSTFPCGLSWSGENGSTQYIAQNHYTIIQISVCYYTELHGAINCNQQSDQCNRMYTYEGWVYSNAINYSELHNVVFTIILRVGVH